MLKQFDLPSKPNNAHEFNFTWTTIIEHTHFRDTKDKKTTDFKVKHTKKG